MESGLSSTFVVRTKIFIAHASTCIVTLGIELIRVASCIYSLILGTALRFKVLSLTGKSEGASGLLPELL